MKVSWRNIGDDLDAFPHSHEFVAGQLHEGKTPREFIMWLIQSSPATNVAINDKPVWKSTDFNNVERQITEALMHIHGEPRQASILVTIDYNIQGDWIDSECRSCGCLYGIHTGCKLMSDIDKGWLDVVAWANGREDARRAIGRKAS